MISRTELHGAVKAYLQGTGGTAAQSPRPAGTDRVSVSAGPSDMARWRAQLHGLPDVNAGRVAEIGGRIAQGTYWPGSDAIARQMMSRWLGDRLAR